MSRTPNSEQILAIEHEGGVLLRAGAGSGKTFVLVEHIVHLTRKWMSDFKKQPDGHFEDYLRQKFSQVVMMTFTKKAAGEMSIRLNEKFLDLCSSKEDAVWWNQANDLLPVLTVTTIDGFCRKLITAGYFPHLSTEAKVIFNAERIDQVNDLFQKWFETKSSLISPEILDIVLREKKDLLTAFGHVFSDPGLRLAWKNFSLESTHPKTLGKLLVQSFELNGLSADLSKILALDLPHETERSAFEKFVGEVQSSGLPVVDSVEKLAIYFNFFVGKTLRGESGKKKTLTHEAAHDGLKNLREWARKWKEVIKDYTLQFDDKVLPWMKLCQELFNWFEDHLDPNQGMTFGDIEYFVALGLENPKDRQRILKTFQYFIVDEFQDTSALQFRIIQQLIGSDYKRLFCVGDAKQAIYGFRGGELSVFQDCAELVPKVRSLANNYRSLPEIIHFNNSLFKTILPLGQEFVGLDPFSVKPEDQNVPTEVKEHQVGTIEVLKVKLDRNLEYEEKFSSEEINRIEASLMADSISNHRSQNSLDICTVLYSKLKPSTELIRQLMSRKIGFTAQYKIDLLDDPVTGIFLSLLQRRFDSNSETKDRFPLFVIKCYLDTLGVSRTLTKEDLEEFDLNSHFWGLLEAFRKFIYKLSMTNENSDINLQTIETISDLFHQDPESVMVQLRDGDNQRISLDLRSGDNAHLVQIMTTHASKGLEFDVVYLGGIYTNGKDNNDSSLFGDLPGSFKWYLDLSQRENQKSPLYVFESELNKYKNFSESKRLFYVACTRAKKKLVWVDLEIPEKSFSVPANSWCDGLTTWLNSPEAANIHKSLKFKSIDDFDSRALLISKAGPELPLFFHDPVGIFPKVGMPSELAVIAELSVTRLNSLIDCPRKFYLENTLKLIGTSKTIAYETFETNEEEVATVIRSSADRGTFIHALIAKGIERNFVVPREIFGSNQQEPVEWALNQLKDLAADYELIAEKSLKFKFFNFMISGIPDLILLPKGNQKAQVWDFKTGQITQDSLNHYWVQLSTYAYALFELGRVSKDSEIELKLVFVDRQETLSLLTTFSKCQLELYPLWRSQNEPWKRNLDHCSQCSYGDICLR